MSAGPTGQQALRDLVDARVLEAAVLALKARSQAILHRLDLAATEANFQAAEALRRLDVLAQTEPRQLGYPTQSDPCWQTIARAVRQTCDLEEDARRLLDRPAPPPQNGAVHP